ncbi:HET-domain-containing protein [Coniochaeta ligniaria NRRL 30616]|uniref:HET-domain-containing protein n=1 Tax=Coniochaeta ligniaria NRRL 30616 TaxID=1408157 RepID=A0A1J7J3T2_9PEZI|nr:HET-domain-containing protein [Coniochaeta ligniaria NRRL 30616]
MWQAHLRSLLLPGKDWYRKTTAGAMRLINTKTLILEEFFERDIPVYAILSHTWGPEEVTFQDWLYVTKQNPARWGWVYIDEEIKKIKAKTGYAKITAACRQANKDGSDWIWVDTNCIDKTNSAELSEAINSMFMWYRRAQICYAFLADVSSTSAEDCDKENSDFRNSRWFTRGWTLQELIAPRDLVFLSNQWIPISRRDKLDNTVRDITKIPTSVLNNNLLFFGFGFEHPCIAEIMSWAANRRTTRIEDRAYCLLGLFDINMPLLYGEGSKAFLRLQLELTHRTTDLSFLAWQGFRDVAFTLPALAANPGVFSGAENVEYRTKSWAPISLRVTNLGLSLRLPLVETLDPHLTFAVLIPLSWTGRAVWMPLWKEGGRYFRICFISTTLMVPYCSYELQAKDIVLPIYDVGIPRLLDMSPLLQPPRTQILLTFPMGLMDLKLYRVLDRVTASCESEDQMSAQDFQWDDLLLNLVTVYGDPRLVYGAIEFEVTVMDLSGERLRASGPEVQRVAVLFISRLNDIGEPTTWTCVDIGDHTTGTTKFSLNTRARSRVSAVAGRNAPAWNQNCLLQVPSGRPGCVIMDDLERDLFTSKFGGYDKTSAAEDRLFGSSSDRGYWPIMAQIVLPPSAKAA